MELTTQQDVCRHCGAEGPLPPLVAPLHQCTACGSVVPQVVFEKGLANAQVAREPIIAPDGVLRGKYRLSRRLGEGTHGVTFLAEHLFLGHPCVVKVLPRRAGDASDTAVRRLRTEARAGFRVHDPYVVHVLDCDVLRGTWYFVMEYIEGVDLGHLVRHGIRPPWHQVARLAADAAHGLAAIHRIGLVHRDVKPANLILGTDGRLRVADLGVVGVAEDHGEAGVGSTPEIVGTLAYTAPETFVSGGQVDARADLYSLGATLYHLTTGLLPHEGRLVFQRLIDLQNRPPSWPAEAAKTPAWLRTAILRLLATEPAERFDSALAFLDALQAPSTAAAATPVPPPAEALEPRGIGVLPFENEQSAPDDDWLGYALANYVSRALSEMPRVYVTDQDGLVALFNRLAVEGDRDERRRVLEAGRMAGAATVITGHFRRAGGTISVRAEALRAAGSGRQTTVHVEGQLADLGEVQRGLLERLLRGLGLGERVAERSRTHVRSPLLAAQEKLALARQAFLRGSYDQAAAWATEAVALDPEFAEAIGFVGVCYARVGRYEEAARQHHEHEALARRWGDERLRVEALANLGVMNYFRGDYEAAERYYQEAAQTAGGLGLAVEEAHICNNLGFVLYRRGRLAEAEQAFTRAIETHRAYGGLSALANPYNGLGNVLIEQGRFREARWYYRRALAIAVDLGDRAAVGTTHMHLGRCAAVEQRFAEAQHEFTMALNALEETRFWNGLARAYEYMAEMNLQLGNCDEAMRCADKRIELARQHSNARMEAAAYLQKAESLKRAGRVEEAAACLALGRSIGTPEAAPS